MWRSTCTKSRSDSRLRTAGEPSALCRRRATCRRAPRTARPRGPRTSSGWTSRDARRRSGPAGTRRSPAARAGRPGCRRRLGSNRSPSSPSRTTSSYSGSRETTGTAPPASARSTSCGSGRGRWRPRRSPRPRPGTGSPTRAPGPTTSTRSRRRRGRVRLGALSGSRIQMVTRQSWLDGQPRSARRKSAQRARAPPRPRSTMWGGSPSGGSGAAARPRPRADHLVVAGEEARHQVARGDEARGPRVEAPEQPLHQRPGDLGGQQPLGGGVEAPDVQRARVTQRRGGRARGEGLVHVQDVQLRAVEQVLQRARHVQRQRHRPAALEGQALAHRHQARRSRARRTARRGRRAWP